MPVTSSWPGAFDVLAVGAQGTPGQMDLLEKVQDAVEKIEVEIGVAGAKGAYASIAARLTAIEATVASLGGTNQLLYIRWTTVGAEPLRSTVTSDLTRTVVWVGPNFASNAAGYAVNAVDIVMKSVAQ